MQRLVINLTRRLLLTCAGEFGPDPARSTGRACATNCHGQVDAASVTNQTHHAQNALFRIEGDAETNKKPAGLGRALSGEAGR